MSAGLFEKSEAALAFVFDWVIYKLFLSSPNILRCLKRQLADRKCGLMLISYFNQEIGI